MRQRPQGRALRRAVCNPEVAAGALFSGKQDMLVINSGESPEAGKLPSRPGLMSPSRSVLSAVPSVIHGSLPDVPLSDGNWDDVRAKKAALLVLAVNEDEVCHEPTHLAKSMIRNIGI